MKEPSEFDFGNNKGEHTDPNPLPISYTPLMCIHCGDKYHPDGENTNKDGYVCKVSELKK